MKPIVELTATARAHAETKDLAKVIDAAALEVSLVPGDIVEFVTSAGTEAFLVHRRRLRIAGDGSQQLIIELDYPVRVRS